ncbi:ATP-binding cassette domain-containing protein [Primorskyibacter sp. S187A]|uniref:thiamine ABC transporter ATP-binding protein n=1 Tax=Primorskyibacter sp. S187A TaxID=3415130 RepID=UPI003C7C04D8
MLKLENITLKQGSFSLAADVQFGPGVTAILGPSGAGKSTVLSAIAGFLTPFSGDITWHGISLLRLSPARRPVAMLFQDNNLFPHLTVTENLALALTPKRPTSHHLDQISAALSKVALNGLEKRKPRELSGGQQSRVALARVLLQNRPVLLLDEPFAALGPALKKDMLDLVAHIAAQQDLTCLMVTHDPADAARIAHQTSVVSRGVLSEPKPTKDLLSNPPPDLAEYLGQAPS